MASVENCGVTTSHQPMSFSDAAIAAFPASCHAMVDGAVELLRLCIDNDYCRRLPAYETALVQDDTVAIPQRLCFIGLDEGSMDTGADCRRVIECLRTRSTDGHVRQAALRRILPSAEPWVVPFVVLLAGDYVLEIGEDLSSSISSLDRGGYITFVRNNPSLMRLQQARATSYWACYHRHRYPDRSTYPALVFLHQLERWARASV